MAPLSVALHTPRGLQHRLGSTVLVTGAGANATRANALMEAVTRREFILRGSWMSDSAPFPGSAWCNAVWLLQGGRVAVDALVTHRFTLSEAHLAAAAVFEGSEPVVKLLLVPTSVGAQR